MQVTSAQSPPWLAQQMPQHRPSAAAGGGHAPAANDPVVAEGAPAGAEVSLHDAASIQAAAAAAPAAGGPPAEVFAEIWKNGMKVGVVYANGDAAVQVPVAAQVGGGGSVFAYQRAQETSRQLGGEVRFVDIAALKVAQTRSQLKTAYGA